MSYHFLFLLEYFFFWEIENGVELQGSALFVSFDLTFDLNCFLKCLLQCGLYVAILAVLAIFGCADHLIVYALFDLSHLMRVRLQLRLFESDLYLHDPLTLEVRIEMRIFHDLLVTVSIDIDVLDVILEACQCGGRCNLQRLHLCWVRACSAGQPQMIVADVVVKDHHLFLKKCCSP